MRFLYKCPKSNVDDSVYLCANFVRPSDFVQSHLLGIMQILKLLGDKSKFEILCLLKTHGRYNLEIAEELHLAPATASHHMSMLLSNHMVTVEKKDGRIR